MFQKICQKETLEKAFRKVKKNRGSGGIDRISLEQYEEHLESHLRELSRLLKTGQYKPLPLKRVYIPKSNGKKRPLGIPAIRDRIIQQALLDVIQPVFEPIFAESSYGFRPNKSAIQAIRRTEKYLKEGYEYIVEADIKDFFTALHHTRLMSKAKQQLKDKEIIQILWKFLKAGVMEEGTLKNTIAGTPQGGVISPILANIYLNDFDHKIEKSGLKLVRYADDFVILTKSVSQAIYAMKMIRDIMKSIDLELQEDKTGIRQYDQGFDFLGYHFQRYCGNHKWPRNKASSSFKDKVRCITRRNQPKNVRMVIQALNPVLRGWGNYFKHGSVKTRFRELDSWIRMRLRSFIEKKKCKSKNWKYPNSYFQSLGLENLTNLLIIQYELPFSNFEQPYRRAVCEKSARTVR